MSAEITHIFPEQNEEIRKNVEFAEWLMEKLADNEIAAISCVGIERSGETFDFGIIPLQAESLRLVIVGMIERAKMDMLTSEADE